MGAHKINFKNRRKGSIGPSHENCVLPDYFLIHQAKRCSILSCISIVLLASVSQARILKDR